MSGTGRQQQVVVGPLVRASGPNDVVCERLSFHSALSLAGVLALFPSGSGCGRRPEGLNSECCGARLVSARGKPSRSRSKILFWPVTVIWPAFGLK